MEHGLLSDGVIQEILQRSLETKFSRLRPATLHFFTPRKTGDTSDRAVSIHKWAIAHINTSDSRSIVQGISDIAVKDLASVTVSLTGELVFDRPHLMPPPLWSDSAPLFSAQSGDGSSRFGVDGGNTLTSTGHYDLDMRAAAGRLSRLNGDLELPYERLMAFCPKPMEKGLIKASVKAGINCKVFGLYDYKDEASWVLTRDESPCSLLISKPDFPLPVKGSKIVAGAKFTVWIDNPRYAVRVTPAQE